MQAVGYWCSHNQMVTPLEYCFVPGHIGDEHEPVYLREDIRKQKMPDEDLG